MREHSNSSLHGIVAMKHRKKGGKAKPLRNLLLHILIRLLFDRRFVTILVDDFISRWCCLCVRDDSSVKLRATSFKVGLHLFFLLFSLACSVHSVKRHSAYSLIIIFRPGNRSRGANLSSKKFNYLILLLLLLLCCCCCCCLVLQLLSQLS